MKFAEPAVTLLSSYVSMVTKHESHLQESHLGVESSYLTGLFNKIFSLNSQCMKMRKGKKKDQRARSLHI